MTLKALVMSLFIISTVIGTPICNCYKNQMLQEVANEAAIATPEAIIVPKKVLFIGNSYTYFWNLPKLVELMAKERNIELTTRQSTSGGVSLGTHWRGERKLKSRERITSGDFDAIVLQDHSLRAIDHPDSLLIFGKKFIDLAKANNVKPYIYMTWAREGNPSMLTAISNKYQELADKNQAHLVPVGKAWEYARQLRPDIQLHDPDTSHPSLLGTYLTACVFFAVLTGENPEGLPQRFVSEDNNGDPLFLMIVTREEAKFCQRVAKEMVLGK